MGELLLRRVPEPPAPNGLGVTAAMRARLAEAAAATEDAAQAQRFAGMAEREATLRKAEGKRALVAALNTIAANAILQDVPDETLVQFGFAKRPSRTTRPTAPTPVANLRAEPFPDGTVRLSWERMGNRDSAVFVIETSADARVWVQVSASKSAKAVLCGFAPGVGAWFRVVAMNSVGTADPSAMASIYTPGATAAATLRAA